MVAIRSSVGCHLWGTVPHSITQSDQPQVDTGEIVYVSSLALLKMLKHGKSLSTYCNFGFTKRPPTSLFNLQAEFDIPCLICVLLLHLAAVALTRGVSLVLGRLIASQVARECRWR
jgi:hypothetical protein